MDCLKIRQRLYEQKLELAKHDKNCRLKQLGLQKECWYHKNIKSKIEYYQYHLNQYLSVIGRI